MKIRRNSLVAIDTQILIYAFRNKFENDQQKEDSAKAKALLKQLNKQRVRLCISSITVAEYLSGVLLSEKSTMLRELSTSFEVAVFNLHAAAIAANLIEPAKLLVHGDRPVLMADTKILASIVAYKCNVLFTHDIKLKKLAAGHISIGELDTQLEFDFD